MRAFASAHIGFDAKLPVGGLRRPSFSPAPSRCRGTGHSDPSNGNAGGHAGEQQLMDKQGLEQLHEHPIESAGNSDARPPKAVGLQILQSAECSARERERERERERAGGGGRVHVYVCMRACVRVCRCTYAPTRACVTPSTTFSVHKVQGSTT